MQVLVTAGNTQAPIDRVRCITNIFTGRTGAAIAGRARDRGYTVTLLTSHPEMITAPAAGLTIRRYRTFHDLHSLMAECLRGGAYDAVVHCAAVSDYLAAGVYPAPGEEPLALSAGKLKSDADELWLRLVRAPKLIDMVRADWDFRGVLVKFKLEVGVADEHLLDVAEKSRRQSDADLMVANTLEGMAEWAFVGPIGGRYTRVARPELADRLLDAICGLREAS
jgi:phosphopantothenate-cysteine ligase/phosphopantothenoylcysteine decarboxylase/phosphopantothenate--cysteine ligase